MNDPVESNEGAVAGSSPVPCSVPTNFRGTSDPSANARPEQTGIATGTPVESDQSCECVSWCQAGGKFLASHHRNCRHYDLEGDAHKIITDLLRGIEASAQDTDGIHPAVWEAYKRGKASVWEFDWKEEE